MIKFEKDCFYKVVIPVLVTWDDSFFSARIYDDEFCLKYNLNKITYARLGTIGVLIFHELEYAARFCRTGDLILKGKAIKPVIIREYVGCASLLLDWMQGRARSMPAPLGTYSAPGFLPKKIIYSKD